MLKIRFVLLTLAVLIFAGGNTLASMVPGFEEVRVSTVSGFNLAYMLIDKNDGQPLARLAAYDEEHQQQPSHLLLFISSPKGEKVENARVVYTLVDGRGEKQRIEATPTQGGYVTGVDLGTPGAYLIKAEVAAAGKELVDRFLYVPY